MWRQLSLDIELGQGNSQRELVPVGLGNQEKSEIAKISTIPTFMVQVFTLSQTTALSIKDLMHKCK